LAEVMLDYSCSKSEYDYFICTRTPAGIVFFIFVSSAVKHRQIPGALLKRPECTYLELAKPFSRHIFSHLLLSLVAR
jgi:hypothetical protein